MPTEYKTTFSDGREFVNVPLRDGNILLDAIVNRYSDFIWLCSPGINIEIFISLWILDYTTLASVQV